MEDEATISPAEPGSAAIGKVSSAPSTTSLHEPCSPKLDSSPRKAPSSKRAGASSPPFYKKSTYNYLTLAQKLGSKPGFAIFRRFATLNAKNLLYLQAELALLEDELEDLELEDQVADDGNRRNFQWEARLLIEDIEGVSSDNDGLEQASKAVRKKKMKKSKQWEKMLEIRAKLKEYNDTLLINSALHALPSPNDHDLRILRRYIEWPWYGDSWMEMPESVYRSPGEDPEPADDLVALSSRMLEGDAFSRWFTDRFIPWVHRHILQRRRRRPLAKGGVEAEKDGDGKEDAQEPGETEYSDRTLNRLVLFVTLLVSSLLPTASIIALNYIRPTVLRLVFTLLFSGLFNACLVFFTAAKRSEIFAATVALASVQVVFIGTTAIGS